MKRAIAWFWVASLLLGSLVLSELAWRRKKAEREIRDYLYSTERLVDMGIELRTVVADPKGEKLLDGKPKLRVVEKHRFGGIVDTKLPKPAFVAPSAKPAIWYASLDQAAALVGAMTEEALEQLVRGSEGSGKSTVIAQWHALQVLRHLGERRLGGQTAPTQTRLGFVRDEMFRLYPRTWYRHFKALDVFVFCDGSRVQMISTHKQSEAQGSPLQGYNLSWGGMDETQDSAEVHEDMESRGRSARDGLFPQLRTATNKDHPRWRTLRALLAEAGWTTRTLSIFRSPFVDPRFIEKKKRTTSKREFLRRYGDPKTGEIPDLAPESMLYHGFERDADGNRLNVKRIPANARRITSLVLRRKCGQPKLKIRGEVVDGVYDLLGGHDPGAAKGGTIYLDAFDVPGVPGVSWWVRGETFHERETTEVSARNILARVRKGFGGRLLNQAGQREIVHVRAQPFGQSEKKPTENLYRIFRAEGLDVRAAQYKQDGTGTGVIGKDDRINMLNALFDGGIDGHRRLFVEADEQGLPVAPKLVEALETMERDEKGRAETGPKTIEEDKSDLPAALGYALWPFEKPSAAALREDIRRERA